MTKRFQTLYVFTLGFYLMSRDITLETRDSEDIRLSVFLWRPLWRSVSNHRDSKLPGGGAQGRTSWRCPYVQSGFVKRPADPAVGPPESCCHSCL